MLKRKKALLPKKSFWKSKVRIFRFYCPHCRSERRVPVDPHIWNAKRVLQMVLTATFFTLLTWKWWGMKGVFSFFPFWAVFESVYRIRLRRALPCPHCGFNPYLYLTDVQQARTEIETYWKKRFDEKGIPWPEQKKEKHQETVVEQDQLEKEKTI